MFSQRNQQNTEKPAPPEEPRYYRNVAAYRSYEEVLAAKRRRGRLCRGVVVCATLAMMGGLGCYLLIQEEDQGGEEPSDLMSIAENQPEQSQLDQSPALQPQEDSSAEGEDFALTVQPKPEEERAQEYPALVVKDVTGVVKKVRPSVVGVTTESFQTYSTGSTGSGIILSGNGYIITNNHVIEGGDNVSVTLDNGETYSAALVGADAKTDIAVLKIEAQGLQAAEFGDSDQVEAGEAAVAIGNPMGLEGTVTAGIVSAINRNMMVNGVSMTLIQTDASINPGNSGGALINEYGQVIGVNSAKISVENYEGLGFAIPINQVKPVVEELIEKGYVSGRPLAGVSGRNLSAMAAAFYRLPQGVLVDQVDPNSDAALKGLAAGDILIGVDDIRVETVAQACALRDGHKAGEMMKLTFYHQATGESREINVKLMEDTNQQSGYNL